MEIVLGLIALLVALWVIVMVIGLLGRLVLAVMKPGWNTFTDTWERLTVDDSPLLRRRIRGASDISDDELALMKLLYQRWRAEGRPPLEEWLKTVEL